MSHPNSHLGTQQARRTQQARVTRQAPRWLSSALALVVAVAVALCLSVPQPAAASTPGQPLDNSFPRLVAWWPDVQTVSAADMARYDCVILYDWAAANARAIKAVNPSTLVLVSTSASELTMYTEVNPAEWKNARIAASSAQWCVTQPGSTLSAPITSTSATTINVATVNADRFRVGDVLVIDEEFLEVQAVGNGTPGTLVVRRGAVVGGTRHVAATHGIGTRVAAAAREYPNTVLMDLTDRCPLVDVGNGPENYNTHHARVTAAVLDDPAWDGIYSDMIEADKSWVISIGYVRSFDLDRSNTITANSDAFNAAWAAGVRTLKSRVRALVGNAPIMTNGADADWDLINGTTMERFPKAGTTPAEWRAGVFGQAYPYVGQTYFAGLTGLQPNLSAILTLDQETQPARPLSAATFVPDYQKMRFGLTTALLGDGLFSYDLGTHDRGSVSQLQWFDEYDNAGAGRGYLGKPLGAAWQVSPPLATTDLLGGDGAFETAGQLSVWTLSASSGYAGTKSLDGGAARVDVTSQQGTGWKLTLTHPVQVSSGTDYTLTFRVRADRARDVQLFTQIDGSPYTMPVNYGWIDVDTTWRTFELRAKSSDTLAPTLRFGLGSATGTVWLDDLKMQTGTRPDVWRRDFQGGVALVNASDGAATVDLGGTYRKITGTQVPSVNNGSPVRAVTLPPKDGLIVLTTTTSVAATFITIKASATSVAYPKTFVLSGVLTPGSVGAPCVIYVKKPGSVRWSYSSARLAYSLASGGGANWWYRYAPKLRGTYRFYARFAGNSGAWASQSGVISVRVR